MSKREEPTYNGKTWNEFAKTWDGRFVYSDQARKDWKDRVKNADKLIKERISKDPDLKKRYNQLMKLAKSAEKWLKEIL